MRLITQRPCKVDITLSNAWFSECIVERGMRGKSILVAAPSSERLENEALGFGMMVRGATVIERCKDDHLICELSSNIDATPHLPPSIN